MRVARDRRDGSGSSHSESALAGRASFSRAAKEFFPFITVRHDRPTYWVGRSPGLSSVSTPTSDSFSSASDFDLPPPSSMPMRQRSSSTSRLSEPQPPPSSSTVASPAVSIRPLARRRSSQKSQPPRKISEPFLSPAEPIQAFVPSRPVPAPSLHSPEVTFLSPSAAEPSAAGGGGGRALSPYLRTKTLPTSRSAPNLSVPSPPRSGEAAPRRKATAYEASTFCDTFVYPQPKLKPFVISPPQTPRSDSSSTFSAGPNPDAAHAGDSPVLETAGTLASSGVARAADRQSVGAAAGSRLTFEERVRREGETREHERATWARAAHQASLSKSFDVKRQRRRSKSLTYLQGRPVLDDPPSPEVPSSFDFLRHDPTTPTKKKAAEAASHRPAESRSPLRSAMKAIRRSTSLGQLPQPSDHGRSQPAPQLPRVQIFDALQMPHQLAAAGRSLRTSSPAPSEANSVVDIGFDEAEANVWKAPARPVIAVEDVGAAGDDGVRDEVGLALSPVTDDRDSRPPSSRDRHRQPSRAGSVSSIQAFHRRFPSTASAGAPSRPQSTLHHRQSWMGHAVAQSLDSAALAQDSADPLSHSLRAGRRMSKPPSNRPRAPNDTPYEWLGAAALSSAPAHLPTFSEAAAAAAADGDKYTAIPVVRPLSKSTNSSRSSLDRVKGLQQAWAFPARERHLSAGSSRASPLSPSSPSAASRRRDSTQVSDAGTPVPLFVYGGDYDVRPVQPSCNAVTADADATFVSLLARQNLFYRPDSAPPSSVGRETLGSPQRQAHISNVSLASSNETSPATDSQSSDDEANATITRISQYQGASAAAAAPPLCRIALTLTPPPPVPALRSPESVHRHAYFPSTHRRSLVPELGVEDAPESPDPDESVVDRFPRPPAPAGAGHSYSTSFDSYTQTQDSHYVTADDGSLAGDARSSSSSAGDDLY